jgi:hypothetical protein
MSNASEQFRAFAGLEGAPDPKLGLENAKGKGGGQDMDVPDTLHPVEPEDTKVPSTRTGERARDAKAERAERAAAKKAAEVDSKKAKTPKKAPAKKTAAKTAAKKK